MKIEDAILNYKKNVLVRIFLHALFWTIFYCITYYVNIISISDNYKNTVGEYLFPLRLVLCPMIFYYPLVYYIFPLLLYKRKYVVGTILIITAIVTYTVLDYWSEVLIMKNSDNFLSSLQKNNPAYYRYIKQDFISIIASRILSLGILYQLIMLLAIPVIIKLILEFFRQRIQSLKLAKDNIQLEFNFLKSQVNPHFLFNALNNIYALILHDRKNESAETVARLADFLRYTLYECNSEKNSIEKEIKLLKNYIALEKIRLNATPVNFTCDVDSNTYLIPPLLFMPLVENAFKYCIETKGFDTYINVNLKAIDEQVHFTILNTYNNSVPSKTSGGIGLQNLKKRLEHYYSGKYKFNIDHDNSVFKITIDINLT